MTVAVETVTYQPAQHSATAAAASGSHGRVGERGKRNFSQKQRWLCFYVFCSTCTLRENVCVTWSRPCFPLHNFPVFVAFAATCHDWQTPITEKLLLSLEVTTSGRSSTLASMFLKHTALSRKNRIRITSHLLLRCKAWTHLHLSPSWMAGQATGSANANANFSDECVLCV